LTYPSLKSFVKGKVLPLSYENAIELWVKNGENEYGAGVTRRFRWPRICVKSLANKWWIMCPGAMFNQVRKNIIFLFLFCPENRIINAEQRGVGRNKTEEAEEIKISIIEMQMEYKYLHKHKRSAEKKRGEWPRPLL